jgi:hypothetical protein
MAIVDVDIKRDAISLLFIDTNESRNGDKTAFAAIRKVRAKHSFRSTSLSEGFTTTPVIFSIHLYTHVDSCFVGNSFLTLPSLREDLSAPGISSFTDAVLFNLEVFRTIARCDLDLRRERAFPEAMAQARAVSMTVLCAIAEPTKK